MVDGGGSVVDSPYVGDAHTRLVRNGYRNSYRCFLPGAYLWIYAVLNRLDYSR